MTFIDLLKHKTSCKFSGTSCSNNRLPQLILNPTNDFSIFLLFVWNTHSLLINTQGLELLAHQKKRPVRAYDAVC